MRANDLSQQHLPPDHVTPYDKFAWSDADIERLLVTGGHERDLAAYFGEREYRELAELSAKPKELSQEPTRGDSLPLSGSPAL